MLQSWESLIRKGGFRYKKPDKSIVDLIPFLKRRKVKIILDVGCGAGRHAILLSKNFKYVIGIDMSSTALKITKKKMKSHNLSNYGLIKCNMTYLPFKVNRFDTVVAFASLDKNYLKDIKKSLSEIWRVLNKSGIIFATMVSTSSDRFNNKFGEFVEPFTLRYKNSNTFEHFFEEVELKKLFHGFKILRMNEITKIVKPIDKPIRVSGFDIIAQRLFNLK